MSSRKFNKCKNFALVFSIRSLYFLWTHFCISRIIKLLHISLPTNDIKLAGHSNTLHFKRKTYNWHIYGCTKQQNETNFVDCMQLPTHCACVQIIIPQNYVLIPTYFDHIWKTLLIHRIKRSFELFPAFPALHKFSSYIPVSEAHYRFYCYCRKKISKAMVNE